MGARGRLQRPAVDGLREQRERLETEPTGSSCNAMGPSGAQPWVLDATVLRWHRACIAQPGCAQAGCTVHTVVHRMPLGHVQPCGGQAAALSESTDRTECSASHACRSTHSNSPTASRRTCAAHRSCGPTCGSGESRRRCGRVSPVNGTEAAESGRDVAAVRAVPWNARRIGWAQTCPTVTTPAEHRPFHSISC